MPLWIAHQLYSRYVGGCWILSEEICVAKHPAAEPSTESMLGFGAVVFRKLLAVYAVFVASVMMCTMMYPRGLRITPGASWVCDSR